jgi:predicted O-linked N-acetylglucosamine transferase (SPINDLY family)
MPALSVQQAFDLALQHHRAGRLAEAEALYRQILAVDARNADALCGLGLIAHQVGRSDLAVEWIGQSLTTNPQNAAAHSNLGEVQRTMGRHSDAVASCRRAIALRPDYAEAYNNLGIALRECGHLDQAVAALRQAVQLKPDFAEAHNNLGNGLRGQGKLDEAIAAYRRAVVLRADFAAACNNLGTALQEQLHLDEAAAALRKAIQIRPDFAEAHYNLGNVLSAQGLRDDAVDAYRSALRLKPDYLEAHHNLGHVFREQGQLAAAVDAYRLATNLKPAFPEAHTSLGLALADQGHLDAALDEYRQTIRLNPNDANAHRFIGHVLRAQGQCEAALEMYRQALAIRPDDAAIRDDLILTLHYLPTVHGAEIAQEHEHWRQLFETPVTPSILPHLNVRNPERRLRIGYVSPDFRDHVVGRNVLPLFRYHNAADCEIICYPDAVRSDAMTEEIRQHAAKWRSTGGLTDAAVVEMIRQDGVDILVDLAQHTSDSRLTIFARKAAPVQVSFAGYPESAGVEAIEYRISDRWMESERTECGLSGPPGGQECPPSVGSSAERVFLLDSFWCYDPCGMENVAVNDLPAHDNGQLTFGCLNNFCKVNDVVLRLWARALSAVPASRMIISTGYGSHRQRTLDFLQGEGVKPERVEFVAPCGRREYLERYHRLDIVLDTFPYNGHTTSLDALWMGLPVASLAGDRPVSRAGLSQLSNLGLPELVAFKEDDYLRIAAELANDIPRLQELRRTLRRRMESSVLMDAPRFARNIEAAYRAMWRSWCEQQTG